MEVYETNQAATRRSDGCAGVRARQERVTFATVEDDGLLQSVVRPLVGRRIKLTAGAAGVQLSEYDGPAASGEGASAAASAPGSPAASGGTINKVSCHKWNISDPCHFSPTERLGQDVLLGTVLWSISFAIQ